MYGQNTKTASFHRGSVRLGSKLAQNIPYPGNGLAVPRTPIRVVPGSSCQRSEEVFQGGLKDFVL